MTRLPHLWLECLALLLVCFQYTFGSVYNQRLMPWLTIKSSTLRVAPFHAGDQKIEVLF